MTELYGERHVAEDRSIPGLLSTLVNQFTRLVRTESELARAEISEGLSRMGTALALVVGGAVLLIPALVVLLSAAVAALVENGMSGSIAALIVGGIVLVIGIVLVVVGMKSLKPKQLIPNRTLGQLSRDAEVAKNQMRTRHDLQRAA